MVSPTNKIDSAATHTTYSLSFHPTHTHTYTHYSSTMNSSIGRTSSAASHCRLAIVVLDKEGVALERIVLCDRAGVRFPLIPNHKDAFSNLAVGPAPLPHLRRTRRHTPLLDRPMIALSRIGASRPNSASRARFLLMFSIRRFSYSQRSFTISQTVGTWARSGASYTG
jgi:hypothetical protein